MRPLAQDEQQFRSLYAERDPLYPATADAVISSGDTPAANVASSTQRPVCAGTTRGVPDDTSKVAS